MQVVKMLSLIPLVVFVVGLLSQLGESNQPNGSSMSTVEYVMTAAGILFATIAAYGVYVLYKTGDPVWPQRFAVAAMAIIFIVGGLTWMYGERQISDPLAREAFAVMDDPTRNVQAGDPEYLGHQDNMGNWVQSRNPNTGELFHPSECRPKVPTRVAVMENGVLSMKTLILPVPHRGFDYSKDGLCVSPTDGVTKLVPWETRHSPAVPSLMPFKTPAEIQAEKDAKQAKIDAANKRRDDLRLQQERRRLVKLLPEEEPCTASEFTEFINCKKVTIHRGGGDYIYSRTEKDFCPKVDDKRHIVSARNGMDIVLSLKPDTTTATFHVFELKPGQTYTTRNGTMTC